MLFDDVEDLPAFEHLLVIPPVLLGQLSGEEIEVGLSLEVLERGSELGAELVVGEGEPAVEVLAQDHLRDRFHQRMIKNLGLDACLLGLTSFSGDGLDNRTTSREWRIRHCRACQPRRDCQRRPVPHRPRQRRVVDGPCQDGIDR